MYGEIIRKYCEKNGITDETILNGVNCISRAVKISGNSLLALKSTQSKELKQCDLKNIIKIVEDLTKVYFECKNVEYIVESKANLKVLADQDSLTAVLVNLVKNAVEAFGTENLSDEMVSMLKLRRRRGESLQQLELLITLEK